MRSILAALRGEYSTVDAGYCRVLPRANLLRGALFLGELSEGPARVLGDDGVVVSG